MFMWAFDVKQWMPESSQLSLLPCSLMNQPSKGGLVHLLNLLINSELSVYHVTSHAMYMYSSFENCLMTFDALARIARDQE